MARISPVFERSYGLPFERFERYTPCGRPEDVAAALAPYVDRGCRRFNFVPEAEGLEAAIEAIATVKRLLGLGATVGPRRELPLGRWACTGRCRKRAAGRIRPN